MSKPKPEDTSAPEPNERPERTLPLSDDPLLTTQELMEYLSVSRTKLWQLVNNEGLPAFKLGGDYRYRKSKVDAWIEEQIVTKEKKPKAKEE